LALPKFYFRVIRNKGSGNENEEGVEERKAAKDNSMYVKPV
jgi:hypothetical protein